MIKESTKSISFTALFRLLILLLLSAVLVATSKNVFAESSFTDVREDYWGLENIEQAKSAGIIEGYEQEDGTWVFRPESYVTKQECIAMLYRTLSPNVLEEETAGLIEKHKETLESSNIAEWAHEYAAYYLEQGWAQASDFEEEDGERSGGFVYAKRELIARWAALSMNYTVPPVFEQVYKDHGEISCENAGYVHALYREGIMEGSSGFFRPLSSVKRVEMAAVCTRLLGLEAREKHDQKMLVWYGSSEAYGSGTEESQEHADLGIKLASSKQTVYLHFEKNARIVADGRTVSWEEFAEALAGKDMTVSCYAGGEGSVLIQTAPKVMKGLLVSEEDFIVYRLLTIMLEDGTYVNYIIDENSILPRRMVEGREYSFIADGLTILELQ